MGGASPAGIIHVDNLKIYAHHGVMEQERTVGNNFTVSLLLRFDATQAMTIDNLDATINYADIVALVKSEMALPSRLLEHVVGRIHRRLTERYPQITGGSISLYKLNPPIPCEIDRIGFTFEW